MSNILKTFLAVGVAGVLNSQTSLADEPMPAVLAAQSSMAAK